MKTYTTRYKRNGMYYIGMVEARNWAEAEKLAAHFFDAEVTGELIEEIEL